MDRREAFKKIILGGGLLAGTSVDTLADQFVTEQTAFSSVEGSPGSEYTSLRVFVGPCKIAYLAIGPCGVQRDDAAVHHFVDQANIVFFPIGLNYRASYQFHAPPGEELNVPEGSVWTLASKIGKYMTQDGKYVVEDYAPAESEFVTVALVKRV